MSDRPIKRALISVYDKTGIVAFARALVDQFGIEIISTGGTATVLKEGGIPVTMVEEVTGFAEMLDGRVKTLHPKIHAAILADRDNPEHLRQLAQQGIEPIDMVVVNLYPFEKTIADPNCTLFKAIEMIDIGGPCLLRAAAKNHSSVVVVTDPSKYEDVLWEMSGLAGRVAGAIKRDYASEAFYATYCYDQLIARYLNVKSPFKSALPNNLDLHLVQIAAMRYGENPHQNAAKFTIKDDPATHPSYFADRYQDNDGDTSMSFNNYVDADAALALCAEITRVTRGTGFHHWMESGATLSGATHCCVFVKHTNPCGVGMAEEPIEAYRQAYLGDPKAAMGGILACNFEVDQSFAETVMNTYARWGKQAGAGGFFVEVWIAPAFASKAVQAIREAKKWGQRVRLLDVGNMHVTSSGNELQYKSVIGGMLVQTRDLVSLNEDDWKVAAKREPTDAEMNDLRLAWLVCKHTKSNAVSICKDRMLIGNGAGQTSRVMSCRIATWLAGENGHAEQLAGSVAASDAFFPFRDGPDLLIDTGVTAIIQPGGSKRDEQVIAACNERNVAMIFTGTRHFKH